MEEEARFYKHTDSSRTKISEAFVNSSDDSKLVAWHQVPMLPTYNDVYNLSPQDPGIIRDRSNGGWPRPVIPITPVQKQGKIRKGHLDTLKNDYNAQTLSGMKTGGGSILEFIRKQKEGMKATNREQQMRDSHRNKEMEWDEAILRSNDMLRSAKIDGLRMSSELIRDLDEEGFGEAGNSEYVKKKPFTLTATMEGISALNATAASSKFNASGKSTFSSTKGSSSSSGGSTNKIDLDFDFKVPATEHSFMRSSHFPRAHEQRFAKMHTHILFKTPEDDTRLFEAAIYDDFHVVRGLLEMLPEAVNIVDNNGNTVLSIAALYGSFVTAELLIYAGATLDHKNNFGLAPLDLACVRNNVDVGALLLFSGANTSFEHCSPKMRVALVTARHRLEMQKKASKLFEAIESGDFSIVQSLVNEEGVDVNSADPRAGPDDPHTALHAALITTAEPSKALVSFLLEKGADIGAMDCQGDTPLHLACARPINEGGVSEELIKCVNLLLEKEQMSMDQLAPNRQGRTALFHACMTGNLQVTAMLFDKLPVLANRHELERRDIHGHACLYYANAVKANDLCAFLVQQGLTINMPVTAV